MKKQMIHRIIVTIAACSIGAIALPSIAGQDESQRQMTQRILKAKQTLKQAEAAKGSERHKLMGEHMKMMKENMKKMQAMKPRPGMSMDEHEDWMSEHQKLMDDMMSLMMEEHHMMMNMDCMSMMGSGDKHQH